MKLIHYTEQEWKNEIISKVTKLHKLEQERENEAKKAEESNAQLEELLVESKGLDKINDMMTQVSQIQSDSCQGGHLKLSLRLHQFDFDLTAPRVDILVKVDSSEEPNEQDIVVGAEIVRNDKQRKGQDESNLPILSQIQQSLKLAWQHQWQVKTLMKQLECLLNEHFASQVI